jgi:acyl carrier protein
MRQELRRFIVDNYLFGQNVEFSDDDSLQEKGIIDSTGVLELVAFLEDTYHVGVHDNEFLPENLDSISRLTRFLEKKLQAGGPQDRGVAPAPAPSVA